MNIAFIPVRGGSKSIPLKNIKLLNGKPLVYWTALAAEQAKCIDKLLIATDSEEIKSTVLSFGFKKLEVYDRDKNNAADTSSTEDVMLEYINKSEMGDDDLFFLIQATSPMLKAEHIDGMYNEFCKNDSDSMFTGVREKQFKWVGVNDKNGLKPAISTLLKILNVTNADCQVKLRLLSFLLTLFMNWMSLLTGLSLKR